MSGSRDVLGVLVLGAVVAALGCSGGDSDGGGSSGGEAVIDPGDGGNYEVTLDPTDFAERIDHPFLPFTPGSRWVYESDDGSERIEVEVLTETRQILGIVATIVRDTVTEDGEVVEDTYDWYAQDDDGTSGTSARTRRNTRAGR